MDSNLLDFVEYKKRREIQKNTPTNNVRDEAPELGQIISSLEKYVAAYERVLGIK